MNNSAKEAKYNIVMLEIAKILAGIDVSETQITSQKGKNLMLDLICPICRSEHPMIPSNGDIHCSCGAVFFFDDLKWKRKTN